MNIYIENRGLITIPPDLSVAVKKYLIPTRQGYFFCKEKDFLYVLALNKKLAIWCSLIRECDKAKLNPFYEHYRRETMAYFQQLGFTEKLNEELDFHIPFLRTYFTKNSQKN